MRLLRGVHTLLRQHLRLGYRLPTYPLSSATDAEVGRRRPEGPIHPLHRDPHSQRKCARTIKVSGTERSYVSADLCGRCDRVVEGLCSLAEELLCTRWVCCYSGRNPR